MLLVAKYAPSKNLEKMHMRQNGATKRSKFREEIAEFGEYRTINRDVLLFTKVHYIAAYKIAEISDELQILVKITEFYDNYFFRQVP